MGGEKVKECRALVHELIDDEIKVEEFKRRDKQLNRAAVSREPVSKKNKDKREERDKKMEVERCK